jgi:hypothetical protein
MRGLPSAYIDLTQPIILGSLLEVARYWANSLKVIRLSKDPQIARSRAFLH